MEGKRKVLQGAVSRISEQETVREDVGPQARDATIRAVKDSTSYCRQL